MLEAASWPAFGDIVNGDDVQSAENAQKSAQPAYFSSHPFVDIILADLALTTSPDILFSLDNSKYKETIQSVYVSGMVFFIALFTYATVLDSQLSKIHNETIDKLIEAVEAEKLLSKEMINQYAQQDVINVVHYTNEIVILLSLIGGVVFVVIGVGLRYSYGIGDEK